jgi:hypothetical protein
MAHAASPETLLAVARDLFGHAPEAWVLAIPVEDMSIGETLTPFAQRALSTAIEEIKKLTTAT